MKRFTCIFLALSIFLLLPTIATASSPSDTVVIIADLQSPGSYRSQVDLFLSDPSIDEVTVLDALVGNSLSVISADPIIEPNTVVIYRYRAVNVHDLSDQTGTTKIATSQGEPGVTVSISKTVSVSNSFTTTLGGIQAGTVTASVGFNVSASESIAVGGSALVPETHDGKAVLYMNLDAYTVYSRKGFDVERHKSSNGMNFGWSAYGTGTAKRAYGVSFKKTYTYK